uniref:EGF-like domain-containing protein n=1 Tax=Macrostomum lignano TaxID=282301 RepID=A0A1I8IR67_9PLAT
AAPANSTAAVVSTSAPAVPSTAAPSSCAAVVCQNLGSCYVSDQIAKCGCRSGFTGSLCERLIRLYRLTFTANDEAGTPLTWDAAVYGDPNNQQRKRLGDRMCTGIERALLRSSNPKLNTASYQCSLANCRQGSVLADIDLTITFHPNITVAATRPEVLAALNQGMAVDNATFGSSPIVEWGNPCSSGNRCSAYGTCQNSGIGTYACTCNSGFADSNPALPGTTCTQLCTSNTCSGSNRDCVQRIGSLAQCQCSPGYSGSDCSQQVLSPAIIGLIVACCVLFLLALIGIVLYIKLRRRNNSSKRHEKVTTLEGDAFMMSEAAKWRAVNASVRSDRLSAFGAGGHQTYPESAAGSSLYIRGQEGTSASPSRRAALNVAAAPAASVAVQRESSWQEYVAGDAGRGSARPRRAMVTDFSTPVTEPAGYPVSLSRAYAERFTVDYGQSSPVNSAEGRQYF